MNQETQDILKEKLEARCYQKLIRLNNPLLHQFVAHYVKLCNPDSVVVCDDAAEDVAYIKDEVMRSKEEKKLAMDGHTIHFDGYYDQGRDAENTKFLLPKGVHLGSDINSVDKEQGWREMRALLKDIMRGHRLYIQFFCLGPTNSEFSIPCVQLTDSSYVAHSSNILYRTGYEEFRRLGDLPSFFKFIHSEGELDERGASKHIDKRRIYIDIEENIVCSVNTQYGGNTIGHKKLGMRLAIHRASKEDWLTEHMFIMGVHGPRGRMTYFTGAFPSLCGKTATAMIEGETIVGDDIAYLRRKGDQIRAVNVEKGMFGIIQGVNSQDDSILWKVLHHPGEIIFSNVLMTEDKGVYWLGKDGDIPPQGFNHSGEWTRGKKDAEGKEISPAHPNARFTIDMALLENTDSNLDDPRGVAVGGIIYGGRDSDTWVPVEESFNWTHGIVTKGASLESETTAAALGKVGIRKFDPMANLAFLSIPIGKYIENNLRFGAGLSHPPPIFSVNYFLKDAEGNFVNEKTDKRVWLKWMELRSHRDVEAIETPTSFIPKYRDLKRLFIEVLNKEYSEKDYIKQFALRVPEHLAKIDRITTIYETKVPDAPPILFTILEEQRERLKAVREKYGDRISPEKF